MAGAGEAAPGESGEHELSARDRAILAAVAAGTARLGSGALYLDGRCCCDQAAAHRLVRDGLIVAGDGPARLSATGVAALESALTPV
jgi:hypothetical protein